MTGKFTGMFQVRERELRNRHPHAEAIAAITIWGSEYAAQSLGCMDWWDSLPDKRKTFIRELLDRTSEAPRENNPPHR